MFGMGTGGSLRLLSPEIWGCQGGALPFAFPFGLLRFALPRVPPLCFPLGPLRFASLSSHPQNRTGSLSLCSVRPRLPFATRFDILQITSTVSGFVPRSRILLSLLLFPVHSSLFPYFQDQALDRLVSPSSIHYCTSTDDLSTLSSSRGLTRF